MGLLENQACGETAVLDFLNHGNFSIYNRKYLLITDIIS
jgi:hypothetical protein